MHKNDWREQGQDKYLKECIWFKGRYFTIKPNDHDHCEYCWRKFCLNEPDCLKEGYYCDNGKRWICNQCWDDFSQKHHLKLKS